MTIKVKVKVVVWSPDSMTDLTFPLSPAPCPCGGHTAACNYWSNLEPVNQVPIMGGPRQCGLWSLPDTSTHNQHWESNRRSSQTAYPLGHMFPCSSMKSSPVRAVGVMKKKTHLNNNLQITKSVSMPKDSQSGVCLAFFQRNHQRFYCKHIKILSTVEPELTQFGACGMEFAWQNWSLGDIYWGKRIL